MPSELPKGTILIVDDDAGVRQVIKRALEHAGYDVLVAASSSEALELFQARSSEIALIISDVMMPRESGPQMIARLLGGERRPPVLYVSGYAEAADVTSIVGQGAQLLPKPFMPDVLIQKVRQLVDV